MEAIDFRKFIWINRSTKGSCRILAVSPYKDETLVVYQCRENDAITITNITDFCDSHQANIRI